MSLTNYASYAGLFFHRGLWYTVDNYGTSLNLRFPQKSYVLRLE
jgi:hypothetical protein